MKLLYFDDFKLGVLKGESVVDVSAVVQDIPHIGPHDLIGGLIARFGEYRGRLEDAARRGQGDVVAGHVIGASLFNLTVVVGGMALFRPVPLPDSFLWLEVPAAAAFGLALYPMLKGDLRIGRGEGAILVLAFLAWFGFELFRLRG